jgi:16S rRNA (cytidine1402-2'-O)-methyltransferase
MPLVFVPTPLGNLRDITLRALDALRECDLLVAEDTRVARKLLAALDLPPKELRSYREQNAAAVTTGILERARESVVAVVCDAGTPGISDPGAELMAAARRAEVSVDALPGPSAVIGAVVLCGFDVRQFTFGGFLPRTSGARKAAFAIFAERGAPTTAWYESPRRILASLRDLAEVDAERRCFILREYTKLHEQQIAGTAAEAASQLAQPVRGEIVFVVEGSRRKRVTAPPDFESAAAALLRTDRSVASIAKTLAERGYGERREIYSRIVERKARQDGRSKDERA